MELVEEGKRTDEHTAGLLEGVIGAVVDRYADGEAVRAADSFEIDGQSQIERRKRRYPVARTECVDAVVQGLGQNKTPALAHGADHRTLDGFENGGLARLLQDICPIGLVALISGGNQIVGFLLYMCLVAGARLQNRLFPGEQIQIGVPHPVAQQNLGPSVGNDVVELHHQPAVLLAGTEQKKPV